MTAACTSSARWTKALTSAREGVADHAPRITVITIPKDKIRDIIGTGGKVIREITEETGAKIDIEDDGTVKVAAVDKPRHRRRSTGSSRLWPSRRSAVIYTARW